MGLYYQKSSLSNKKLVPVGPVHNISKQSFAQNEMCIFYIVPKCLFSTSLHKLLFIVIDAKGFSTIDNAADYLDLKLYHLTIFKPGICQLKAGACPVS